MLLVLPVRISILIMHTLLPFLLKNMLLTKKTENGSSVLIWKENQLYAMKKQAFGNVRITMQEPALKYYTEQKH